jgi:hypothetical protein
VVREPVRERGPEGERRGLRGGELGRGLHSSQPGRLGGGDSGEPPQERIEEQRSRSLGLAQEEPEPPPPEAYIEDGLLEGLALLAG